MRAGIVLTAGLLGMLVMSVAYADSIRYRGAYTYGHEVNIFCPVINSQCYWLGSETPADVRGALRTLAEQSAVVPYESVCVVVEAEIDRESHRDGFAANYDGLIGITKLYGRCDETSKVTQGDLQHHRWVLESINGETLDYELLSGRVPDLEFGEQMHVTGNSGCNSFFGQASLHGLYIRFGQLISTEMFCGSAQNEIERTIQQFLTQPDIRIEVNDNHLNLQSGQVSLRYRLHDWVD